MLSRASSGLLKQPISDLALYQLHYHAVTNLQLGNCVHSKIHINFPIGQSKSREPTLTGSPGC
jgi:hypothetical protein